MNDLVIEKPSQDQKVDIAAGTIVSVAFSAAEAAKYAASLALSTCSINITNLSNAPLVHNTFITPHGTIPKVGRLPTIPPQFSVDNTPYSFTETVIATESITGVACLTQWKIAMDSPIYLTVFTWLANPLNKFADNAGGVYLSVNALDLNNYWKNAVKADPEVNHSGQAQKQNCYLPQGELSKFDMQLRGKKIEVSLTNDKNAQFDITLRDI